MIALNVPDLPEALMRRLARRAAVNRRSVESEVLAILQAALPDHPVGSWATADAIYKELAASGRTFSDSAKLIREDRGR